MGGSYDNQFDAEAPLIRQLTKGQRRVLGVLIEKGLTTPDQYPLTLKSVTSGANQKSNRDPVTNYSEAAIWELLDELRELGLVAVLLPESGRTERFRHYMRRRFPFSESQLGIMTELFLRGRQQLGELRVRVSRMVPIETLEELRSDLTSLMEQGFIQANGPLERRGIEVDHNMYLDNEHAKLGTIAVIEEDASPAPRQQSSLESRPAPIPQQALHLGEAGVEEISQLKADAVSLRLEVESLRQIVENLQESIDELRRSLGV